MAHLKHGKLGRQMLSYDKVLIESHKFLNDCTKLVSFMLVSLELMLVTYCHFGSVRLARPVQICQRV